MPTVLKTVPVAKGAAEYLVENRDGKWSVIMFADSPTDGGSTVQSFSTEQLANSAAIRWQKRENKAVLESQGYI